MLSIHMSRLWLQLPLVLLACLPLPGCFPAKETPAADLGGLRCLAVQSETQFIDVADTRSERSSSQSPMRLVIAKVRRATGPDQDSSLQMVTLAPSDDERRATAIADRELGGSESDPITAFIEPGLAVTAEGLHAEAHRLGARSMLVYTYWSKQETDTWSFPFLFTLGLAPVLNSSYQARVEAVAVNVASGSVEFDATETDEGWQVANGYTRPKAERQVSRRVERRAFGRIMDRYIVAMGGPANPPRQEPMGDPW